MARASLDVHRSIHACITASFPERIIRQRDREIERGRDNKILAKYQLNWLKRRVWTGEGRYLHLGEKGKRRGGTSVEYRVRRIVLRVLCCWAAREPRLDRVCALGRLSPLRLTALTFVRGRAD